MYAITDASYRAISSTADLQEGETAVENVPVSVLMEIERTEARDRRNSLLRDSDWTQVPDTPLPDVARSEWVVYRQALRDLPQRPDFPDCAWPDAPGLPAGAAGGGSTPIP